MSCGWRYVLEVSILALMRPATRAQRRAASLRTTLHYSSEMARLRPAQHRRARLRAGLAATAAAGAALLLAATFMTIIAITVDGESRLAGADTHLSGWDRHGPALLIL